MSLGAALVDRAFLLRKTEAEPQEEVEGTVIFDEPDPDAPEPGPEFRCRLDISSAPERTKDGMTQADPRPKLLTGKRDKDGVDLEFRIGDQIKVVSRELGTAVWEVDDDPEPLRKRRAKLGWELTLHRVVES